MELKLYQIDAFADNVFKGNPAAVCPLDKWLPDEIMQLIAEENNLSETAFYVPIGDEFQIRWFAPKSEVKLCGHATLASAYVIFDILKYHGETITFRSKSGKLEVKKDNDRLAMNFPSQPRAPCEIPKELENALNNRPAACLRAEDYIVIYENEEDITALTPDNDFMKKLDLRGVITTSRSKKYDFVLRFFAPKFGIPEDPVTGSALTQLIPYWAEVLGKAKMSARQVSKRGGDILCKLKGDRVIISGRAVKYCEGEISIDT